MKCPGAEMLYLFPHFIFRFMRFVQSKLKSIVCTYLVQINSFFLLLSAMLSFPLDDSVTEIKWKTNDFVGGGKG